MSSSESPSASPSPPRPRPRVPTRLVAPNQDSVRRSGLGRVTRVREPDRFAPRLSQQAPSEQDPSEQDPPRSIQNSEEQGSLNSIGTGTVKELLAQSQRSVISEIRAITAPIQASVQVIHDLIGEQSDALIRLAATTNALLFSSPLISSKSISSEAAAQSVMVDAFVGPDFMRRISATNFVVFFTRMFVKSPGNSKTTEQDESGAAAAESATPNQPKRKKRKTYVPQGPIDPSRVLRVMMFAPHASTRKRARQLGPGKDFMELRVQMLASMVASAERLHPDGVPLERKDKAKNEEQPQRIERPAWATKGLITRNHVEKWRKKYVPVEVKSTAKNNSNPAASADARGSQQIRKKPRVCDTTIDETAREVLKRLWSMQTEFLSRSREYSRTSFLVQMGFLFMPCNLILTTLEGSDYMQVLDQIPDASVPKSEDDRILCIKKNSKTVESIIQTFPELDLICTYDVQVYDDSSESKETQSSREQGPVDCEPRRLTTTWNVFIIAAEFLTSYHQLNQIEELFLVHRRSFRYVFCIAMAFKALAISTYEKTKKQPESDDVPAEALDIGVVPPNTEVRNKFITSDVLKMGKSKYNEINTTVEEAAQIRKPDSNNTIDEAYDSDDDDVIIVR